VGYVLPATYTTGLGLVFPASSSIIGVELQPCYQRRDLPITYIHTYIHTYIPKIPVGPLTNSIYTAGGSEAWTKERFSDDLGNVYVNHQFSLLLLLLFFFFCSTGA
jgi:hypothetical protein